MAVVDRRAADSDQTRHPLYRDAAMSHVDPLGADPDVDFLTDQAAGDRVGVAADLNRTATADANAWNYVVGIELAGRQGAEVLLLDGETFVAFVVPAGDHIFEEIHVVLAAGEVTATANHQSLVDDVLEMTIGRFHIAVFVGTSSVGLLSGSAIVVHQGCVALGQLLPGSVVVHGRAEAVGSVALRHPAELPKCLLNPFAEGFKRFGEAERNRFDVGVSQHAVKQRVIEPRPGNRHAEFVHHGEVTSGDLCGVMHLREHHRLVGSLRASPQPHPSLKRPPGGIGVLTAILLLQPPEERFRLQPRFGFQSSLNLRPDVFKGIDSRPVGAFRLPRRGESLIVSIVPCGLLVHACDPCRGGERLADRKPPPQFFDLPIRDHRNLR